MLGKLVKKVFPESHWRWRNENERVDGSKGPPTHGRAWFHFGNHKGYGGGTSLYLEWCFPRAKCGIGMEVDALHDNALKFNVGFPPIALYWGIDGIGPAFFEKVFGLKYEKGMDNIFDLSRVFEISVHDWTIWWKFWARTHEWRSSDPKWMHASVHVLDTLFGRSKYHSETIGTEKIEIPMPEGKYEATVTFSRDSWTRPRWPFKFGPEEMYCYKVRWKSDLEKAIPFPGKGENSWDCGQDGLFGSSGLGMNKAEVIAQHVKSVLETRLRRGGNVEAMG